MFVAYTQPARPKEAGWQAGLTYGVLRLAPQSRETDWHPADIMAALRKCRKNNGRGWTFRSLSLAHGYSENAVGFTVRDHPWPAIEAIVAAQLNLHPKEIWPSRYNSDGTPKRRAAHPLTQPITQRRRRRVSNGSAA